MKQPLNREHGEPGRELDVDILIASSGEVELLFTLNEDDREVVKDSMRRMINAGLVKEANFAKYLVSAIQAIQDSDPLDARRTVKEWEDIKGREIEEFQQRVRAAGRQAEKKLGRGAGDL
jgi:hypothetical protein